jgi:hypothetical protein
MACEGNSLINQGSDELAVAAFSYMAAMSTAWLSIIPSSTTTNFV